MNDDRDEILRRTDLQALGDELVGPKSNGGRPCPNPNHAQTGATPPVSIKAATATDPELWHCHGCGAGGTAVDLVMLALNLDTGAAFAYLREQAGVPAPRQPEPARPSRRQRPPRPVDPHAALEQLEAFLAGRGWSAEVAGRFGLTAVRDDRGLWRIRFPFRCGDRVVWWQDRLVSGSGPKFLAPPGSRPVLYSRNLEDNLEAAHKLRCAVVVEGPTDVVALDHAFECPAVLGIPGVNMPVERWVPALAGLAVALVADNDDAGERFREKAGAALASAGCTVDQVRIPAGHNDLDDLRRASGSPEAFAAVVLEAFDHVDAVEVTAA